ncbi:TIGR04211 family SH3 domain-containing protein [Vibrio sp. MarTm2]|uniref:Arylsulfatase n=3 Tax=Vibrio TaxID=662 RepID=A0A0A5HYZ8_PHOS4|nr:MULTISPECIES: TIGR04211 family SH3 domain-containing protein [Vibrio]EED26537.1 SH3 domain protein [Vibrio sp. 16]KGY08729.1 arylsulfatase [Vibrio sinaloensis]KHA58754.1 arylsulfatase [Vibrio variabilis]KHD23540.1 arylsulfatase [Vibrio caribbeanicus]KHT38159.1 arylsulfatase [Vibrio sinaloensis]
MKKLVLLVLATLVAAPAALAQDRYIADKLFTYMHSGPSNQYRIIGSIDAGDKVKLLSTDRATGYSQIQDDRGRKGWVESKFVTSQESMALRLPKLEKELAETKERLANARSTSDQEKAGLVDSLETSNRRIAELEQSYTDMSQQLSSAQEEVRSLRAKLDTQKDDLLLKYFMYGGGVAGLGLLFGLILPHIIPRKKRSPSGWA